MDLPSRHLDDYADAAGAEAVERARELAKPLAGAKIVHLNATAHGGGVAELLQTQVPLMCDVGLDAEWHVLDGSDEFFEATKTLHNALQGMDVDWNEDLERAYLDRVAGNAEGFVEEADLVLVHDPQPAALLACLGDERKRGTKWVWRCHIDLTRAQTRAWEFLRPFVELHDAAIFSMPEFVPDDLDMDRVLHFPPSIDPLSEKNVDLSPSQIEQACRDHGIDPDRPLVCQVSRFDPWKDPVGVIKAFVMAHDRLDNAQLVLAGAMADDDPEGREYLDEAEAAAGDNPDVHLLVNLDAVVINALQRKAAVVVQKSLREGFGLTVSEALWKGRPVVGGQAGGITLQVRDGQDGFLVDSVEDCADRIAELVTDPARADELGRNGRARVRERFLATRELADHLELFAQLLNR